MTVRDVELDMATAIASRVASLTLGTNTFAGPVRPVQPNLVPGQAVFAAIVSSGPRLLPMRETDAGSGPDQLRAHRVQIRVRGPQDDLTTGAALARQVRDAIAYRPPSGYNDIEPVNPSPLYIGKDDKGHHEWAYNIDAMTEETTT